MTGEVKTLQFSEGVTVTAPSDFSSETRSVTSDDSIVSSDRFIFVDATSGNVTLTALDASTYSGYIFTIFKTDSSANVVIIEGSGGGDEIRGIPSQTTYQITNQYQSVTIISDGTNWYLGG